MKLFVEFRSEHVVVFQKKKSFDVGQLSFSLSVIEAQTLLFAQEMISLSTMGVPSSLSLERRERV